MGVVTGSSPLTRGRQIRDVIADSEEGLIPAHAGSTTSGIRALKNCPGSSPLTRGRPRVTRVKPRPCRLIPAHAGSTKHSPTTN
ncbi:hypothetical protein HMPREF0058_1578 [Actinomyces urogenitalis DSM 15434]|nr:hypothetical protein HMPREF0058_1578 [Actinomyces urogenitalis DSM 15434]